MKRWLVIPLAFSLLLFAGCKKQTAPAAPAQSVAPAAPAIPAAPETPRPDDDVTIYNVGGIKVPVPKKYDALLTANTELEAWSEHWQPLISFAETASVEAGQRAHPGEDWGDGELCTLMCLDRIGFEEWASGDDTGTSLFARDGEDAYYLMAHPTDVRLCRDENQYDDATIAQWTELNEWAGTLAEEIIARNGLTAYGSSDIFGEDYIYGGEHVEFAYRLPSEALDLIVLSLSQPVKQGEGGFWCVERVRNIYSEYGWTSTHLVFPAALGIDETAESYYARIQAECDKGEHPELLTPRGAALDYAKRVTWLFGEDVSASDFEELDAVG